MHTKTLQTLLMSSLLTSATYANTVQLKSPPPILRVTPISIANYTASKEVDPIYNLYQLSKLISLDKDNEHAYGYLNHLFEKRKIKEDDILRTSLLSKIKYKDESVSIKNEMSAYFVNNLKSDDLIYNDFYKNYIEGHKDRIKLANEIIKINKVLITYRNVDVISQLNNQIGKIDSCITSYLLSDLSLDASKIDSIHKHNQPLKDILEASMVVERLDDTTLKGIENYLEKLKVVENTIYQSNRYKLQEILKVNAYYDTISKHKDDLLFKKEYNDIKLNNLHDFPNLRYSLNIYQATRKIRDEKADSLFKLILGKNIIGKNKEFEQLKKDIAAIQISNELIPVPTLATLEERGNGDGFKLPSESDVIMGVAKFMANRAKQETMIWFIDRLKNQMSNNLVQSAFPRTYHKIIEHEDLRVPEFNSSWQLAISEVFVKLPVHIVHSKWLAAKAADNHKTLELEKLKETVGYSQHFFSLMNGRNDYRNILENLYTQHTSFKGGANRTSLYRAVEFLYIVSNEFYEVDAHKTVRNLNFSDFENIDKDQWDVLLKLIQLKYGKEAYDDFAYFYFKLNQNSKNGLETVNRKFAQITNTLALLESTSKSNAYSSKEDKAAAILDQTLTLLKFFDPEYNPAENNFNIQRYIQVKQFEDLLNIYKLIGKKDFGNVTKSTLEFVKPFVMDSFQVHINANKVFITSDLSVQSLANLFEKENNSNSSDKASQNMANRNELIQFDLPEQFKFKDSFNVTLYKQNQLLVLDTFSHSSPIQVDVNQLRSSLKELKLFRALKSTEDVQIANQHIKQLLTKDSTLKELINVFISNHSTASFDTKTVLKHIQFVDLMLQLIEDPTELVHSNLYQEFNLQRHQKSFSNLNDSGQMLVKTTSFFSDILNSRNEDGVYRAIDNAVAPPNSYMTKRKSNHSLTLNGYVGAYAGYQHVRPKISDYRSSMTYGITAPIGLTYSTPKWGIFVQAIDLGNIVGHYLWEKNKAYEKQKVSVQEVFSPGINFLYNLPDSPFVLYTGFKMIQVEERFEENVGYINTGSLDLMQFTAGIKIDIPFFTVKRW